MALRYRTRTTEAEAWPLSPSPYACPRCRDLAKRGADVISRGRARHRETNRGEPMETGDRSSESDIHARDLEVMILENKLRDASQELVQAFNQNEKLVNALHEARERMAGLKEEVDRLSAPPATYGVYLSGNDDGTVNVLFQGRKAKVNLHPSIKSDDIKPGQELILNDSLNVVQTAGYEVQGDVVILKEQLAPGRAVVTLRADEEKVGIIADPLRMTRLKPGDHLLMDAKSGYLLEQLPKSEVEDLTLEAVPDIGYEDIGGIRKPTAEAVPVVVCFDEMDALFRTRGTGISSDMETTIVPQLLTEIDGVERLTNVIVIGASNRQDLIDPAILRPGRLDVKIKIERPDKTAAVDIFNKYMTAQLPIHETELRPHGGDMQATLARMIEATIDEMYSLEEENRFLEVTYANGDKEVLYFKDFSSGAMIESIVRRGKKLALKRYIQTGEKGIKVDDLLSAVREEFKENEDLPNTTNPDDWAKIAGKKGERIVYVKPLMGETKEKLRSVERVVNTGQYL